MNLYSHKQRWKITLLLLSLFIIGASLFVSNSMIEKISLRERGKARQWAEAIKKKGELVQLTNQIFNELREKEKQKILLIEEAQRTILSGSDLSMNQDLDFAIKIIKNNKDIPVILLNDDGSVAQQRNIEFNDSANAIPSDSVLQKLAKEWKLAGRVFEIEVYRGMFMTFVYGESRELLRLKMESDAILSSFTSQLLDNSDLIPVLLIDKKTQTIEASNLLPEQLKEEVLKSTIKSLAAENTPLTLNFGSGEKILYFSDSPEVRQLIWFPYIQFSVIALIVIIGYLMFSTFRKAEQNQVWAGMAKETAHQLGTPLSSMMAWVAHLEASKTDPMVIEEMHKDLDRLEKITDRFSKIGSGAKLTDEDLMLTIGNNLDYLRARLSDKITISFSLVGEAPVMVKHNAALIEWVIENICKNAVDAMDGKGDLTIEISRDSGFVHIDISDTGKGLTPKQFKTIFQPGFSTKKRGWGLGLTLVKRIIEEYHNGKVFVLKSEIDKGTIFRISIPS